MPFGNVKLVPGVNVERTPTLNETGYEVSTLGRFRDGLFQKLGGWVRYYVANLVGIARDIHAWQDLNLVGRLGVGTTSSLNVIASGGVADVTPQLKTTNPAVNFSTVNASAVVTIIDAGVGSVTDLDAIFLNTPVYIGGLVLSGLYATTFIGATTYRITAAKNATATVNNAGLVPTFVTTALSSSVRVTIVAHGVDVGSKVTFTAPTTFDGVTVSGTYTVTNKVDADHFDIAVSTQAVAGATQTMNGGVAQIVYYINLGPSATSSGYSIGTYSSGGYGTGATSTAQTGTPITATDWMVDNWGEILVACPSRGAIYYWPPNAGFANANSIVQGPPFNGGIFVAMPQQMLVAWGSTIINAIGQAQDPLLVRWCDVGNFAQWTATSTTQAGSFRLSSGSKIMGGMQGPQRGLLWTDVDVWAMDYLGPPLVFGFNKIGSGGLIGPHAMTQLGATVYYIGGNNLFRIAGAGPEPMHCPVWDVLFQDLDTTNAFKCRAGANTPFNEVFFFYPSLSGGTGECDKYIKFNVLENVWDYGSLPRSTWIDQSVLGPPIATQPVFGPSQTVIYQHESGNDGDGSPINAAFESGYFMIAEGDQMCFVDWLIPDFKFGNFGAAQSATLQVTLKAVDFPGDTPRVYGPFTFTSTTQAANPRLRGRQMSIRVESTDLGSFWRLGNIRYRYQPDGRL